MPVGDVDARQRHLGRDATCRGCDAQRRLGVEPRRLLAPEHQRRQRAHHQRLGPRRARLLDDRQRLERLRAPQRHLGEHQPRRQPARRRDARAWPRARPRRACRRRRTPAPAPRTRARRRRAAWPPPAPDRAAPPSTSPFCSSSSASPRNARASCPGDESPTSLPTTPSSAPRAASRSMPRSTCKQRAIDDGRDVVGVVGERAPIGLERAIVALRRRLGQPEPVQHERVVRIAVGGGAQRIGGAVGPLEQQLGAPDEIRRRRVGELAPQRLRQPRRAIELALGHRQIDARLGRRPGSRAACRRTAPPRRRRARPSRAAPARASRRTRTPSAPARAPAAPAPRDRRARRGSADRAAPPPGSRDNFPTPASAAPARAAWPRARACATRAPTGPSPHRRRRPPPARSRAARCRAASDRRATAALDAAHEQRRARLLALDRHAHHARHVARRCVAVRALVPVAVAVDAARSRSRRASPSAPPTNLRGNVGCRAARQRIERRAPAAAAAAPARAPRAPCPRARRPAAAVAGASARLRRPRCRRSARSRAGSPRATASVNCRSSVSRTIDGSDGSMPSSGSSSTARRRTVGLRARRISAGVIVESSDGSSVVEVAAAPASCRSSSARCDATRGRARSA